MANIRIKLLPTEDSPNANDVMALDGATTRQATIKKLVYAGRPSASQAEAEAGSDADKVMTPITVAQAIAALGATKAQGDKADAAVPTSAIGAASGVAGLGGDSKIPNAQIPDRLVGNQITDANTFITPGFAWGLNAANAPASGYFTYFNRTLFNGSWGKQIAKAYFDSTEYEREPFNGVWSDWRLTKTSGGALAIPNLNKINKVSVCDPMFMTKAQYNDVHDGNMTLDVAAAVQAALDYNSANKNISIAPYIKPKLGSKLVCSGDFCIEADPRAQFTWVTPGNAGWKFTGGNLSKAFTPQPIGPNNISGYVGDATNTAQNYNTNGFTDVAYEIENCVFGEFFIQQPKGWGTALKINGDGGLGVGNLDINFRTGDLCKQGILIVGTASNFSEYQSRIKGDNIFAKFPLVFDLNNGSAFNWIIDALGFSVAEAGGQCISILGATMVAPHTFTNNVITGVASNQYSASDSPYGTPTNMLGPILGGDQTGPKGAVYANGAGNRFELMMPSRVPSATPAILMLGATNSINVHPKVTPDNTQIDVPIPLSQTQGLANFNGGKICLHDKVRVQITLASALPAYSIAPDFFYYNEKINPSANLPVITTGYANQNGLAVDALPQGGANAFECVMRVKNTTNATIAAGTVLTFWAVIA